MKKSIRSKGRILQEAGLPIGQGGIPKRWRETTPASMYNCVHHVRARFNRSPLFIHHVSSFSSWVPPPQRLHPPPQSPLFLSSLSFSSWGAPQPPPPPLQLAPSSSSF